MTVHLLITEKLFCKSKTLKLEKAAYRNIGFTAMDIALTKILKYYY